jgi:exodeoxyribonuclease VII small subunit
MLMAKTASKKPAKREEAEHDFESALERLEEIVERLDEGNLPLAQSLELFKEGTLLAKRCRDLLSVAELTVKEALASAQADDDEEEAAEEPIDDETLGEDEAQDDDGA